MNCFNEYFRCLMLRSNLLPDGQKMSFFELYVVFFGLG